MEFQKINLLTMAEEDYQFAKRRQSKNLTPNNNNRIMTKTTHSSTTVGNIKNNSVEKTAYELGFSNVQNEKKSSTDSFELNSDCIGWDNMFDTEMLPINEPITKTTHSSTNVGNKINNSVDKTAHELGFLNVQSTDSFKSNADCIGWDNMFDTEILPINEPITKTTHSSTNVGNKINNSVDKTAHELGFLNVQSTDFFKSNADCIGWDNMFDTEILPINEPITKTTHSSTNVGNKIKNSVDKTAHELGFLNVQSTDFFKSNADCIGWDNMFDTEMLSINETITKTTHLSTNVGNNIINSVNKTAHELGFLNVQNEKKLSTDSFELNTDCIESDNKFDFEMLSINGAINKTTHSSTNIVNLINKSVDKTISVNNSRQIYSDKKVVPNIKTIAKNLKKRKLVEEEITNEFPKKIKNIKSNSSEDKTKNKNIYRKEKYTKTVKKWLDNNQSIIDPPQIDIEYFSGPIPGGKPKIKKTVQSRLINKNGKMKYTKDSISKSDHVKQLDFSDPVHSDEGYTLNEDHTDMTVSVPFVELNLPSDVIMLSNMNIHEELINLKNILSKNHEIVLLLMYSNGCNQLDLSTNKVIDPGTPDGLLIQLSDHYYYLKGSQFTTDTIKLFLKQILTEVKVICYDGKAVLIYLAHWLDLHDDIENMKIIDIKIGVSLLYPDEPTESFTAAAIALGVQDVAGANSLRPVAQALRTALAAARLDKLFNDIEMPIVPIVARMEFYGIEIDMEKLQQMESTLSSETKAAEAACHKAAGRTFTVTSPAQVHALLYDELRLHTRRPDARAGPADAADTSESTLKKLNTVHPLPNLILEFRRLHKTRATFVGGLAHHARDNVVSPHWEQTAAATGRIACRGPNLQAVPKAQELRSVLRARTGRVLLAADFQQIECRVFAALAADRQLTGLLTAPGDFFRLLAAQWLGRAEREVSPEERDRAKRIVYASLYGAGPRSLAHMLDTTYEGSFPSLKKFGEEVIERCRAAGGSVATPSGRRRHLPDIVSDDFGRRAHAQRQAVNFLVQGTAADVCKVAMRRTAAALRAAHVDAPLLLQVHDELVWEVPQQHLHKAAEAVRPAMEACGEALGLALRLPVALSAGPNWGDMAALS